MPKPIQKTVLFTVFIVFFMFAFSFAFAPLYSAFCRPTGINTLVRDNTAQDLKRNITVQFVTTNNKELPLDFYSRTPSVSVHPNQIVKVLFFLKNTTNHEVTIQAIASFAPTASAKYFHKIECFCFTRHTLKAGEELNMPVVFRIDDQIPQEISTITLAYGLFDETAFTKRISP